MAMWFVDFIKCWRKTKDFSDSILSYLKLYIKCFDFKINIFSCLMVRKSKSISIVFLCCKNCLSKKTKQINFCLTSHKHGALPFNIRFQIPKRQVSFDDDSQGVWAINTYRKSLHMINDSIYGFSQFRSIDHTWNLFLMVKKWWRKNSKFAEHLRVSLWY